MVLYLVEANAATDDESSKLDIRTRYELSTTQGGCVFVNAATV
jgi:hypothetical protein